MLPLEELSAKLVPRAQLTLQSLQSELGDKPGPLWDVIRRVQAQGAAGMVRFLSNILCSMEVIRCGRFVSPCVGSLGRSTRVT